MDWKLCVKWNGNLTLPSISASKGKTPQQYSNAKSTQEQTQTFNIILQSESPLKDLVHFKEIHETIQKDFEKFSNASLSESIKIELSYGFPIKKQLLSLSSLLSLQESYDDFLNKKLLEIGISNHDLIQMKFTLPPPPPATTAAPVSNTSDIQASSSAAPSRKVVKVEKKETKKTGINGLGKMMRKLHNDAGTSDGGGQRLGGWGSSASSASSDAGPAIWNPETGDTINVGNQEPVVAFLRRAAQTAVEAQYEVAEGNRRLSAALSGEYEIAEKTIDNKTIFVVQYHSVIGGGREAWREEQVDGLSIDLLRAAVSQVIKIGEDEDVSDGICTTSGRAMLRPHMIAQVSPRVFWSIIHHFGSDIPSALKQLLPEEDWDYLKTRDRKLSEKALNNKRMAEREAQEKVEKQKKKQKQAKNIVDIDDDLPPFSPADIRSKIFEERFQAKCDNDLLDLAANEKTEEIFQVFKTHPNIEESEMTIERVETWINFAQTREVEKYMKEIIKSDAIRAGLRQVMNIENPLQLSRLKIPGRIAFVMREFKQLNRPALMGIQEAELQEIQKKAQEIVDSHPWMPALLPKD